jgi:hypothetical protein
VANYTTPEIYGSVKSSTHLFPYFYANRAITGGSDLYSFTVDSSNSAIHLTFHNQTNVYTNTYQVLNSSQTSISSPHSTPQPAGTYYIKPIADGGNSAEFGFVVHPNTSNYVDSAGETSSTARNLGTITSSVSVSESFFTLFTRVLDANAHTYTVNFSSPEIPLDQRDFYKFHLNSEGNLTINYSGSHGDFLLRVPAQGNIDSASTQLVRSGQSLHLIAGDYTLEVVDSATTTTGSGQNVIETRNSQWENYDSYNFSINFVSGAGVSQPDLVENTVSLGNSSVAAGGTTTVSHHLQNVGNAAAGGSSSRIYLSTDSTITTSDTVLSTLSYPAALAAGSFTADTQTVTVPGNLAPGTYYIGLIADYNDAVVESNNSNNASAGVALTVTAAATAGSVSINDVSVTEGNSGTKVATFTATRSGGSSAFSVNFATSDGSATTADGDYNATSGTLSFATGVNTQTLSVTINGDTKVEPNQTFLVNLSGATNGATIGDGQGVGTITNDDRIPINDFNGDGKSDILWRNDAGPMSIWDMNGGNLLASNPLGSVPAAWKVAGTGDFNGDGKTDILWRNDNGALQTWDMNDGNILAANSLGTVPDNWKIAGIGDFNGDGKSDIVWRNDSGPMAIWNMNDGNILASNPLGTVPAAWKVAGIGDFNADGKSDFLWRNDNGALQIWDMNDNNIMASNSLGTVPDNWKIAGLGDFNGDRKSDILWRNDNGALQIWDMNDGNILAANSLGSVPANWKIADLGDYNGNGKSDILWRNDTGPVAIWDMDDGTLLGSNSLGSVPANWHIIA